MSFDVSNSTNVSLNILCRLCQWKSLYSDTPERLEVVVALLETRDAFLQVRSLLRHVGEAAGVPVSRFFPAL